MSPYMAIISSKPSPPLLLFVGIGSALFTAEMSKFRQQFPINIIQRGRSFAL